MAIKGTSKKRALLIEAALEEAGLHNPVSVVAIIRGLSAIIAAIQAFEEIRSILKREKGG